jgi:hypothetical protein
MTMILLSDDRFHARSSNPYWNESGWFSCAIPERNVNAWIYIWHRPNMNLSAGGLDIWDDTGEHPYTNLFSETDEHQELPPGADMFDCHLRNGFTIESIELQKRYRIRFDTDDLNLDLQWEGLCEPIEMVPPPGQDVNPILREFLTLEKDTGLRQGHYEQPGRMTGKIVLAGEELDVDCFAIRDHTWAPRVFTRPPRGGYAWAIASRNSMFFAPGASMLPHDEDPIAGTTEIIPAGWYVEDGKLGRIVEGERRIPERGPDGRPLVETIEAVDEFGRTLSARGVCQNWFHWLRYSTLHIWGTLARWEFNGQQAWGEIHDYMTLRQNRRLMKALQEGGVQAPAMEAVAPS